jgi:hypothetical protein
VQRTPADPANLTALEHPLAHAEPVLGLAGLQALDARLAGLQGHLARSPQSLRVMDPSLPCCEAAEAVVGASEGGCVCCSAAATTKG